MISIVPSRHTLPCRFLFPFFPLFFSFFVFPPLPFLSLSVFPFLFRFRFVFSFCRVSVSCTAFALLFASLLSLRLGGGFCYPVISSSVLHPPRAPRGPEVCGFPLRAVLFLAFLLFTVPIFLFFLLLLPFFDFDLDIFCFILSFSCGYCSVS